MNLVINSNFENEKLDGWTIDGDKNSVNLTWNQGDTRDKVALHYWANTDFKVTISQKFTGLTDGKYTLSCWTQGKGTAASYKLFASTGGQYD